MVIAMLMLVSLSTLPCAYLAIVFLCFSTRFAFNSRETVENLEKVAHFVLHIVLRKYCVI